ncbi:MAG: DUF5658 family protein [Pseudomonadota bacterium]
MESGDTTVTKRLPRDRRRFTWRTVLYGFLYSRRRDLRRDDDGEAVFVDWHHPWLRIMAVGTMILSATDAFLTLKLIEKGMIEANPVMANVMGHGTLAFTASKMFMTAIGIFALVFLAKAMFMKRIRTGQFLTLMFVSYLCLVCYELVHIMDLYGP